MTPDDELRHLRARLAEVTGREARYRLQSVQDYLELQERLRTQSSVIGERGTYIHQLHLERNATKAELQAAHADLELLLQRLHSGAGWPDASMRRVSPLERFRRWLAGRPRRGPSDGVPDVPPGDFTYYLHTSPFRIYRGGRFVLRGWAFPRDGRAITGIRVRLAGHESPGRHGLPEPEVIAVHGPQPANPQPGFEVEFPTPPGTHWLRLEARLGDNEWRSILKIPAWVQPKV